jgi:hypothetical protein
MYATIGPIAEINTLISRNCGVADAARRASKSLEALKGEGQDVPRKFVLGGNWTR